MFEKIVQYVKSSHPVVDVITDDILSLRDLPKILFEQCGVSVIMHRPVYGLQWAMVDGKPLADEAFAGLPKFATETMRGVQSAPGILQFMTSLASGDIRNLKKRLVVISEDHTTLLPSNVSSNPSAEYVVRFRDVVKANKALGNVLITTGPRRPDIVELDRLRVTVTVPLPDTQTLRDHLARVCKASNIKITSQEMDLVAKNSRGLTSFQAENAWALAAISSKTRKIQPDVVQRQCDSFVEAHRSLKVISKLTPPEDYAGHEKLMDQLRLAQLMEDPKFRKDYALDGRMRMLLTGPPGTGKTVAAEVCAHMLGRKLIKWDLNSEKGMYQGDVESNFRKSLSIIKATGPCVLLIDEADKAFADVMASMEGNGAGSSGMGGVFAELLYEMDKGLPEAFLILSGNHPWLFKEELIRRAEPVFYLGYPRPEDTPKLIEIHMRLQGIDPEDFRDDIPAFSKKALRFTGDEIRRAIRAAKGIRAIRGNPTVLPSHIDQALNDIRPVFRRNPEYHKRIRLWAEEYAMVTENVDDIGAFMHAQFDEERKI